MIFKLNDRGRRWLKLRRPKETWMVVAALAISLLVSACGSSQSDVTPNANRLPVLTTTALLADLVENVGGGLVNVTALVPPGADVHSFQSTPADNVAVSRAALLVSNGGGLDQFLDDVIESGSSNDAVHILAAESLLGLESNDPHFWQNPIFAMQYAEGIRDGLITADPDNAANYQSNFQTYKDRLTELDFDIASILSTIQADRRHLITFHDAFGHFATRYGWQVTSLVGSDASQVSPGPMVEILNQVRNQGIPAIFAEPQFSFGLLENAAEEAGVEVGPIYSDVQDAYVTSYIDMMIFNAKSLAKFLR